MDLDEVTHYDLLCLQILLFSSLQSSIEDQISSDFQVSCMI